MAFSSSCSFVSPGRVDALSSLMPDQQPCSTSPDWMKATLSSAGKLTEVDIRIGTAVVTGSPKQHRLSSETPSDISPPFYSSRINQVAPGLLLKARFISL
ncbi:unnamed protein product [Protopolystoma xenopodis]|uniref:Uncharacterized protein n=1 Tax=Protopolystoma xenopodis TaxID=117903 RepID=A0A448WUS1_9PLAT|nr:unnamed protein product [Protopolystoma xenopodis]